MPREGHDGKHRRYLRDTGVFQSTCPARGTTLCDYIIPQIIRFQSTCPARGTTRPRNYHKSHAMDFNPRAPRGARHTCVIQIVGVDYISIHVPREGHDPYTQSSRQHRAPFQSTCPARGTTACPLAISSASFLFQSTCPARGTTVKRGRHF